MDFTNFINTFWDNTLSGLSRGAIYALIALGYTLVYGVLRLINFANSEVFMLGTMGSVMSMWILGIDANGSQKGIGGFAASMLLMFALSVLFSGFAAVALEFVAYRPLRRRNSPRLVFLISAIGASLALAEAVGAFPKRKREEYPFGRLSVAKSGCTVSDTENCLWNTRTSLVRFGDTSIQIRHVVVLIGSMLMMAGLWAFVNKTRQGRGMRAVAMDAETSRILGVNVDQVILITFLVGGVMAGGAAFLYMLFFEATRYNVGFLLGVKSFTAAVLGGIGNITGALVGGLLLGLFEEYGAGLFGGKWKDLIAFAVLVLVLMFRPTGLLGESLGRARA
jgi:branched-chain amino acid transport system permease protein